jgi:hypothetical protein
VTFARALKRRLERPVRALEAGGLLQLPRLGLDHDAVAVFVARERVRREDEELVTFEGQHHVRYVRAPGVDDQVLDLAERFAFDPGNALADELARAHVEPGGLVLARIGRPGCGEERSQEKRGE